MSSLSSPILIYVSIQRLLDYSISDFEGNAEKYNHINIKHLKHGPFYESSYLPNYAINYIFQNSYLEVWKNSE